MAKELTVIDVTERTIIGRDMNPRWAHQRAREVAKSTGHKVLVLKPVAQYERCVNKKRFK